MVKPTVSTVLWMMFAWMLSMPVMAEEVKKSPAPLVEMSLSPSRIDWHSADPAVKVQRWVLILAGPDELFLRREFKAGKAPFLSLFDSEGDRLPDGSYTWELKAVSQGSAGPRRESGSFSIKDGSFVEAPQGTGGGAPKPPLVSTTAEDFVASGGITIQSSQPYIIFDDMPFPEIGMFSSHDWALITNMNDIDQFSLIDWTNGLVPFNIAAGAPGDSLHISSNGNVGLGTPTPTVRLDLKANVTGQAAARLQNSSATGYSGIEYLNNSGTVGLFFGIDNAASTTRFNSVNNNPIVILTNSTERLRIASDGKVGIGTSSPTQELTVKSAGSNDDVVRVARSSDGATIIRLFETSSGAGLISLFDDAGNEDTRVSGSGGHSFFSGTLGINCNSNGGFDFGIKTGTGASTACNTGTYSVISAGSSTFTTSSSRSIKENLAPVQVPEILDKISAVGVYSYDFIDGPKDRLGLMAEDFHQIFQRGSDKVLDGQEVEMALWLAVQELTAQNKKLSERLAELEARLAANPVNAPHSK